MILSLTLLLLLAAAAVAVGLTARYLRRPIPRSYLAVFFVLAVLPFGRAFVSETTPLPLDHVVFTHPWWGLTPGAPTPYNPYLNDVVTQILPWTEATRLALREGEMPWRNRWNGCGMPLAANGISAALSPLTLFAVFLPMARAFTLIAALKLLFAASGMWLWARELGATARASGFAAVAFGLSFSFTPPWLFFPQSAAIALWPWMLFLIERCRDEAGRGRAIAALTAAFAATQLVGHSETAVKGYLFGALWLAARWMMGDLPKPRRLFGAVAASAALAVGLTAFLLIPSLFAIAGSGRIAAASKPYWEPILSVLPHGPQWRAAALPFFPHALGNAFASPTLPFAGGAFPETGLGYIGIIGWVAALLFLRPGSPRGRTSWILLAMLLIGFGVAVGQWPIAEIFSKLPGIRYIFPIRFHSWVALAGAALAALELDRFAKDLALRRRVWIAGLLAPLALALAAVLVFLRFSSEHAGAGGTTFQTRQLAVILGVLGLAAALAFVTARRHMNLYVMGLTVLCGAELLYQWRLISRPVYPTSLFYPETPLIRFLRAQPGAFRVVGEKSVLFPSTNVFARVEDIRTHDAVERRDYLAFLDATVGYPYEYFKTVKNVDAPALDFLNVRFVLTSAQSEAPGARWRSVYSGPDGRIFENASVLPRAYAPDRVRTVRPRAPAAGPVSDANAAFGDAFGAITANRDWRRTGWVLGEDRGEIANAPAEISDYFEAGNRASFRARVRDGTSHVFLSIVQDGGWSARDPRGRVLPLTRANGPFFAVALPAGEHEVRLRYSPPGLRAGAAISLATAALAGAFAIRGVRRRRRGIEAAP